MIAYSNIRAYIDSEWGSRNQTICLQVLLTYGKSASAKYLIFHNDYKNFLESKGYKEGVIQGMNVRLKFDDFSPDKDILTELISEHVKRIQLPLAKNSLKCDLYLFFSPKDLINAIGKTSFLEQVYKPSGGGFKIEQKRSLRGCFSQGLENGFRVDYTIKDISGWGNRGLQALANSLGVAVGEKSLLDDYKSKMEEGLIHCTDDFIKYSINDVVILEKIVKSMVKMVNWLCKDILTFTKTFNQTTIPMSQGSLVSSVFISYLYSLLDKSEKYPAELKQKLLSAAFCKIGLLKKDTRRFQENFALHKNLFDESGVDTFFAPEKKVFLDDLFKLFAFKIKM